MCVRACARVCVDVRVDRIGVELTTTKENAQRLSLIN